jgi:hypothetical protein
MSQMVALRRGGSALPLPLHAAGSASRDFETDAIIRHC